VGTATGLSDIYNANVGAVITYTLALEAGTYYWRALAYAGATLVATIFEGTVTDT
jgi:hypothetical protein